MHRNKTVIGVMSLSVNRQIGQTCEIFVTTEVNTNVVQATRTEQGNRDNMFSLKRLMERNAMKIQPRNPVNNNNNNNKCIKWTPECAKIFWLSFAIIVTFLAVILVAIPLILSKIPPRPIPQVNNTLWEISTELTLIRWYRQVELFEANCSYGFEFNNYLCLPPCDWHPAGPTAFLFQRTILIMVDLTGIVLCVVSISAWVIPFIRYAVKNRSDSLSDINLNLPRVSLFMQLLSVSVLILLYATTDIPQHEYIFCNSIKSDLGIDFSLVSPHSDGAIELYGALFHYFTLAYLLWTVFSWLNIILMLFFPLQISSNFKLKNYTFLFEFLASLLTPFIAIFLAIDGPDQNGEYSAAYGPLQIYRTINIIDHSLYSVLYELPHFACLGLILIFNVVIVYKLKVKLIKQSSLSGRKQSVGGFETRFMIHSIVLIILNILINTTVIAYRFVTYEYYWNLEEIIGCVTLESKIAYSLDGDMYRGRAFDLVNNISNNLYNIEIRPCGEYFLQNENLYPSFLFILSTISLRLIWLSVFVVLIPQFSPTGFYRFLRGYFSATNPSVV